MTDGLNARFTKDPVAFLDSDGVWDINATGVNGAFQPIYKLDQNNVGSFDLYRTSDSTVNLRDKSAVSFWATSATDFFKEPTVKAYYLNSILNKTNSFTVSTQADYFFTDTITGCSFMAFGSNRLNLTVSHANAFEPAKVVIPLTTQEQTVQNSPCAVKIVYGASQYRAFTAKANTVVKPEDAIVTIIGWRRSDGWHFYARRRVNGWGSGNQYALGGAFEI